MSMKLLTYYQSNDSRRNRYAGNVSGISDDQDNVRVIGMFVSDLMHTMPGAK